MKYDEGALFVELYITFYSTWEFAKAPVSPTARASHGTFVIKNTIQIGQKK